MQPFVIVKTLVVRPDGKVLIVRRSTTDTRRPLQWDFPGGFVDPGEDIMEAALRETKEETGVEIAEAQLIYGASEAETDKGYAGTRVTFIAHIAKAPKISLSYEHDDYAWVAPKELLKKITYDRQLEMIRYVLDNGLFKTA